MKKKYAFHFWLYNSKEKNSFFSSLIDCWSSLRKREEDIMAKVIKKSSDSLPYLVIS